MVVVEVTGSAARRRELGACLRSYRRLIAPEQVGLPAGGRRRTPGLRREEVATLAGVGLSWYTWLEQGRVTASGHVLESVGRVLGVDDAGRRHLRLLSAPAEPPPVAEPAADLAPLIADFAGPAVLLDHRLDVVAANPRWVRVWGDPRDVEPGAAQRAVAAGRRTPGRPGERPRTAPDSTAPAVPDDGEPVCGRRTHRAGRRTPARGGPGLLAALGVPGIGAFGEPTVVVDGHRLRAHLLEPAGRSGSALLFLADGEKRGVIGAHRRWPEAGPSAGRT